MDLTRFRRPLVVMALGALAVGLVAGPVLGVDPSPTADPPGRERARGAPEEVPPGPPETLPVPAAEGPATDEPETEGPPAEPPGRERARVPASPVTVTGTVRATEDEDGRTSYTLEVGSRVYELGAGPPWWWGDDHPLADHVGDQVTVAGEQPEGSDEIDVESIDGQAIREPGKPPWAGGPKAVGERHPGWAAWSAAHPDGKPGQGRGLGRDGAPGQQRDATDD